MPPIRTSGESFSEFSGATDPRFESCSDSDANSLPYEPTMIAPPALKSRQYTIPELVAFWSEFLGALKTRRQEIIRLMEFEFRRSYPELRVFEAPVRKRFMYGRNSDWYVDETGRTPDEDCKSFTLFFAEYIGRQRSLMMERTAEIPVFHLHEKTLDGSS